jgi:hypothetical protein
MWQKLSCFTNVKSNKKGLPVASLKTKLTKCMKKGLFAQFKPAHPFFFQQQIYLLHFPAPL